MATSGQPSDGIQLTAMVEQPDDKPPSVIIPTFVEPSSDGVILHGDDDEVIDKQLLEDVYEEDEFGNRIPKAGDDEKAKKEAEEKKKKETEAAAGPTATMGELFGFTTTIDKIVLFLSILGAIAQGAAMPLLSLYMGNIVNDMNSGNFTSKINQVCIFFVVLALASGFGGFLAISGFTYVAERQAKKLRNRYLRAMLRQDISWYDQNSIGDVSSRLTAYSRKYQDGVGDKFGLLISNVATFIIGLIIAFYRGWELTLIILAPAPILLVISAIFAALIAKSSSNELGSYATANSIALQTFDNIRTVISYQMETFLIAKYTKYSRLAYKDGTKKGLQAGGGLGAFYLIIFLIYALGLFYGGYLMKRGARTWPGGGLYDGGAVLSVFYALLTAVMILGQSAPNVSAVASSKSALGSILEVINRESEINPFQLSPDNTSKYQVTRKAFTGGIAFQNVSFRYPTRPEALVLDKFTYCFEPYTKLALVGHSGCGKTSLLQLIELFYHPNSGNIYIEVDLDSFDRNLGPNGNFDKNQYSQLYNDVPMKTSYELHQQFANSKVISTQPRQNTRPLPPNTAWINLRDISVALWRRECIGMVNQQPILFNGSIADNLRYGAPDATQEELEAVATKCNAHDFIIAKPRGYDTNVGENGSLLSGGQKQRLSLARTIITEKKLVLLDEITAQVDSLSERQIQSTLDQLLASNAFSSISIAHRLSTIRDSDIIVVMREGTIVETGTHKELSQLTQDGLYYGMININKDAQESIRISEEEIQKLEYAEAHPDEDLSDHEEIDNDDDRNNTSGEINDKQQSKSQPLIEHDNGKSNNEIDNDQHHDPISTKHFSTTVRSSRRDFDSQGHKIAKKESLRNKNQPRGNLRRFLKQYVTEHWNWIIPAVIFGGGEGASFPIYSLLMAKILAFYYLPDKQEMYTKVSQFCGWFALLGLGACICALIKIYSLTVPAERLVFWFRTKVFTNLLYQEVGFFDQEANSSSILTTKLASDTNHARDLITALFGQIISILTTIIASFIISFIAGWQMTLVMLIIFPILTICGVVQFKILSGFGSKSKKFIERSSLIAVEGLRAIRVVASFNAEESLYRRFAEKQARIVRIGSRSAFLAGLGFGGTQFFLFASYALSFYVGALFVEKNYMTFEDMMKVFLSLEMASMMAGQVIAQAAMVDKARAALIDLYSLVDRKSLYDCRSESGQKHPITHGKIEFKDVKFHYPTAPLLPVLKGVSFVIDPETLPLITNSYQSNELTKDSDQTLKKSTGTRECYFVGVIGSSGGGKSTMFSQLLPHFYRTVQPGGDENFVPAPEGATLEEIAAKEKAYAAEKEILEKKLKKRLNLQQRNGAKAGQIFLDGHNIDTFNLHHLRQHMALVQQEPVLFHGTIRENIIAGDESISEEEMIEAAKIAYIHHIIIQLPKGYNTMLTSNNSLSGGQKARVAIARALARKNLKLIAFDESTSALDVKASRIILHNLRHSMKDKILVFIAHRLETVVNAQKILVLDNGVIAENGTHKELYALNGIYANLVRLQQ